MFLTDHIWKQLHNQQMVRSLRNDNPPETGHKKKLESKFKTKTESDNDKDEQLSSRKTSASTQVDTSSLKSET